MNIKQLINDRTILFFICSLIVTGIAIYKSGTKNEPTNIQRKASKSATLYGNIVLSDDALIKTISPGEDITILGQRTPSGGKSMVFWAETNDGQRGYIRQESIDENIIVFDTKCVESNEIAGVQAGDTVRIVSAANEYYDEYNIVTRDGKKAVSDSEGLLSATGMGLLDYGINEKVCYFLSRQKFEKMYLGKKFAETEQLYRKAWFVRKKGSGMEADYPLFVFDKEDGSFHIPTIVFENDIAISYTTTPSKKGNKLFLRILPLSDKILDVDLFSRLISRSYFSREHVADNASVPILLKVALWLVGIFIVAGFLSWLFLSNIILPSFLFGLMRFRYPLIVVSNKAMRILLLMMIGLCTYIWIILGLAYSFSWWYFLPILLFVTHWATNEMMDFFSDFPPNRCPDCKRLYCIEHVKKEQSREYQEWREVEDRKKIGGSRQRFRKHDVIETTYQSGRKEYHNTNYRTETQVTDIYQNDKYDVLYLVHEFLHTYKCKGCGHLEYNTSRELEELDRKYKGSYASASTYTE
ncbi:MAG: hypothetical protein PHE35_04325 [Bacteroidales bacterium]|nr:hypothetical protein [Bacteroidales bacterium]MDD3332828.1 hypothetical protein [Proteiniphilum sp.]MDY0182383.1 hypothetical protein [Proteiniphilum sp.]